MSASTGETELAAKRASEYNGRAMSCVARPLWRGGRVVYGSGLENQRGCKPTVGSNPTRSALERSHWLGFVMPDGFLRAAALLPIGEYCGLMCRCRP